MYPSLPAARQMSLLYRTALPHFLKDSFTSIKDADEVIRSFSENAASMPAPKLSAKKALALKKAVWVDRVRQVKNYQE